MKRLFGSCAILVLGMAAMPQLLPAQEGPGLDGVWFAVITPAVCGTYTPIPGAPSFSGLYMYSHDGSLTNEAAFPPNFPQPILQRSSGVGAWKHAEGQTYTATFRFFRYDSDNSGHALRFVTSTIVRVGDQWFSQDKFQDFDLNNNPLSPPVSGCTIVVATRVQ